MTLIKEYHAKANKYETHWENMGAHQKTIGGWLLLTTGKVEQGQKRLLQNLYGDESLCHF